LKYQHKKAGEAGKKPDRKNSIRMFCRHMPIACLKCMQKFKPKTLIAFQCDRDKCESFPDALAAAGKAVCKVCKGHANNGL